MRAKNAKSGPLCPPPPVTPILFLYSLWIQGIGFIFNFLKLNCIINSFGVEIAELYIAIYSIYILILYSNI